MRRCGRQRIFVLTTPATRLPDCTTLNSACMYVRHGPIGVRHSDLGHRPLIIVPIRLISVVATIARINRIRRHISGGRILRKLPGSHLPPPCEFRILRDDVIWAAERRDHIPIQVNLGLIVPGECNMIFGVRLSRPVSHEETNHGIMRAHDLKRMLVDVRPPALAMVRVYRVSLHRMAITPLVQLPVHADVLATRLAHYSRQIHLFSRFRTALLKPFCSMLSFVACTLSASCWAYLVLEKSAQLLSKRITLPSKSSCVFTDFCFGLPSDKVPLGLSKPEELLKTKMLTRKNRGPAGHRRVLVPMLRCRAALSTSALRQE